MARIPLEKLCSDRDALLIYHAKSSSTEANPSDDPFEHALTDPLVVSRPQRHPGPDQSHWKISPSEWPTVLRRLDQGESLRTLAREFTVSHETVRRVVRAARLLQAD
ncbi:MAG: helix-turn-helix domain-containing protein [Ktedonobacteraceae bacterium]